MAIDQNSVPKDHLPLNPNPSRPSAPFRLSCYNAANSPAADELADDQPAARKVKLLCSFGGKILPRPSDGAFRYAGGQTRIIAVRRDITLSELCGKMADVYGAPVEIRYQLPEEDLDALVSVSSAEDLDNMMDEHDKLTEVSGDGSAKLRVFLFSQTEIASDLSDNYFAGPALIYTFDGGEVYVEAVNGVSVSDDGIYSSEIRPKESMASPSSTQNSDAGFNGSYNEGSSPGIVSPITGVSASFDPSMLPFAGTATSVPLHEAQGFPANSTVFGQTMVAAQSLNPHNLAPYASQAFEESHQVPYMPPHSLNMAAAGMINVVSVPQHTYLPSMPIPSSSMPAPAGSAKPIQGKGDPFLEEDQLSGRFVHPLPDHNYKVFQQTLSQTPPLQPSHLPPPSIEPYGLHLVPPLAQGPVLRFENCQMCQKAFPHVHSDRLVNELSNVSGVHVPNDHPIVHSHHSEDIARLQGQHRVVNVAMIESSMEPKVEPTVNPGQCRTYGANNVPDSVLDREKIFGLRQPLGALGLSGDTQASYGVFVSSPQSHFESSFQQQQKQALHGDYFHAAKALHPTAALTLSSSVHPSNGGSLSPPQTRLDGSLQQQNVLLAEGADYIQVLHPSRLSSTGQTSYGVSVEPLEPLHDATLQLKRLLDGTPPPFFPAKQTVIGNQCGKDSSSINNISYNVLEPLSQCQYNVKQVDGLMEDLNVSTIDSLRFRDQLKPKLVPNVGLPKDMKPENWSAVGDDNTFRLQNDSNASLSSNGFITSAVGPEGIYINPVNPVALSTGFSREIRPESSSVVGEDNNTLRPQCDGSKLPSSEAFISTGLLSKENFMGPINPLLSTMMEVHASELANTCQASTMARSSALHTQRVKPLQSSQLLPGVSPYISDYAYTNTIAEGRSRVWKDEVCQVQNLFDYLAASQRGNAPFPLSSSIVPGQGRQFQENFDPCSLLNNEGPQEILGSMNAYLPRPAIVATREPIISGDTSNENCLPKGQSHDVAILLEEDYGADYIDQDLRDIAEQIDELLFQSHPPVSLLPFNRPEEMRPPFLCSHIPSENRLPKGQSHDAGILLEEDYGADYIDQDLRDIAEQIDELLFQSHPPVSLLPFNRPEEMRPPFLCSHIPSENRLPKGQSHDAGILLEEGYGADYIDQDLRDIAEQIDKLLFQPYPPVSLLPFSRPEEMRPPFLCSHIPSENRLPMGQSHDVAILLEEDSGADYIDQDLRDIAEQVGESALQSSTPVSLLPFSRPEEMRPPFLCSHTPIENRLPKGQSLDIAALGALRSPLNWLINESHPDPISGTGPDYIDQDLHDLAEQVAESVLQSSIPPLSVQSCNGPKEIRHPFLRWSGLIEINSTSQIADYLVDQRIEDKPGQSDELHMGLVMANYIGRLQIIKNSDLEELRELGSGTFGTVYHGKWRGSDVAIKRFNDRCFTGKPSEQERVKADFWNEANKLADLHHPNVVTFYGVVVDGPNESLATVTEYMVNGSLGNALRRDDKTLDRWKCLLIAMDVAFGMEYLHGKNIVHFDLKSDNLLVNLTDPQRPICKIGDLGLSKIKCETLVSGGVRGTLPWMAPELLNGCSNMASEKVDVFSFGIVMWELLTREEPYSDLHCGAIISGIVTNTLRPTVPDSCDPEWGSLMEQCWSTDPTERPSFTEIAMRLRSMAASFPHKGQAQP